MIASSERRVLRPFPRWGSFLHCHLNWLAASLIAGLLGIGAYTALARHAAFHTFIFDLGWYVQVIWNTSQGRFFASTLRGIPISLFDHFSPALAILAPLFWIVPDARTLILFCVVVTCVSILPAYLLLRERDHVLAVVLIVAFVLNPFVHQQILDEFHEIVLAVPTLTLALYALYRDRLRLLLIALGLTLLVREDMGIYVASFGLFIMLRQPRRRWLGLGLIIIGAAWMLGFLFLLKPASSVMYVPKTARHLIGSGFDFNTILVFATSILRLIQSSFMQEGRVTELVSIFVAVVGMPLLASGEQVLWSPMMAFLIAASGAYSGDLFGFHAAPIIPLLWVSVARFLSRLSKRQASASAALLLVASVVSFLLWSPFPGGGRYDASDFAVTEHDHIAESVVSRIPANASVAAQDGIGTHLAARKDFAIFPVYDYSNPPQMIVLDSSSSLIYPFAFPEKYLAQLARLQMDPALQLDWEQDGIFVFRSDPAAPIPNAGSWKWPPYLRLNGYDLTQTNAQGAFDPAGPIKPEAGGELRVSLYWTSLAVMKTDYTVSVRLVAPDGFIVAQDDSWPGGGRLATSTWQVGRLIRDIHYLNLPSGRAPEDLDFTIVVYKLDTLKRLSPETGYTLTTIKPQ